MTVNLRQLVDRAVMYAHNDSLAAFGDEEVSEFSREHQLTPDEFCDTFSLEVARLFLKEELTFEEADRAMNEINWYSVMGVFKLELLPELSWQIYLAFDGGEHNHGGRFSDAVASFTKPRLEQLISVHRA